MTALPDELRRLAGEVTQYSLGGSARLMKAADLGELALTNLPTIIAALEAHEKPE